MNVHLALSCALPEGRLRAGGRMRTGSEPWSEPWCKGLTFSRDRPLLRVRLLTGPDRLGPALRAARTGRSDHGSGRPSDETDELPGSRRDAHHGRAEPHTDPPGPRQFFGGRPAHG